MLKDHLVLLVEDDLAYAELVVGAVARSSLSVEIIVFKDGEQVIEYLYQRGPFAGEPAPRPELILLDLRLPRMDGLEVLAEIKNDKELRRIPVVVMSTSKTEEDMDRAYDLGVNGYLEKPGTTSETERMIGGLLRYWLMCNMVARVA